MPITPPRAARDFRAEIAHVRCWDAEAQRARLAPDAVLQNREELVALLEWMEQENIRSYLELGCWTGRLVALVDRLFQPDVLASCDLGLSTALGLPSVLPERCRRFTGSSHSAAYRVWRNRLGHVDLVLIDADHAYDSVRRDFEINRRHPHRFLAFHDIAGTDPANQGVRRFWQELRGNKLEIVRPHVELGLPHTTMGVGIWWA